MSPQLPSHPPLGPADCQQKIGLYTVQAPQMTDSRKSGCPIGPSTRTASGTPADSPISHSRPRVNGLPLSTLALVKTVDTDGLTRKSAASRSTALVAPILSTR